MRTEHLRYLITIAEIGSINKASQVLYINQQQLSKIVKNLEEEFGVKIFERYNNGIKLTAEGKSVYDAAVSITKTLDDLNLKLHTQADIEGELTIKASLSYWDQNIIYRASSRMMELYPKVKITIDEATSRQMFEDCCYNPNIVYFATLDESATIAKTIIIPEDSEFIHLCDYKLGILVSQKSKYAKKYKVVSIEDLTKDDFVVYSINNESAFDEYLQKYGNRKYATSKIKHFYDIIREDRAIAFGVNRGGNFYTDNNITFVPLEENITINTGLVLSKDWHENKVFNSFVEICQREIQLMKEENLL